MSNRNRTLLQLLVDGGKASGYKEDLSIWFRAGKSTMLFIQNGDVAK